MWIPRRIESVLRRRVETRPVVVLTGARQTGKTSLVRRLFPGHRFVTLDYPAEADEAEREPESFLRRHPPPVIVDEVQYAPALIRFIKIAVDENRREAGQFVLTGSQPLRLLSSGLSALAGRASITELEPLSYAEARSVAPGLTPETFLVRGGFPELHADPRLDARDFYRSYAATYLERDLRQFLRVSGLRDHARFLRAVALRTSQLLNRADLARDVGISGSTASSWLSVLEATHQALLLEPDPVAGQEAEDLPEGLRAGRVPLRSPHRGGPSCHAPRGTAVGDAGVRGTPPRPGERAWLVGSRVLPRPKLRGGLPAPPRGKVPSGGREVDRATRIPRRRPAPEGGAPARRGAGSQSEHLLSGADLVPPRGRRPGGVVAGSAGSPGVELREAIAAGSGRCVVVRRLSEFGAGGSSSGDGWGGARSDSRALEPAARPPRGPLRRHPPAPASSRRRPRATAPRTRWRHSPA